MVVYREAYFGSWDSSAAVFIANQLTFGFKDSKGKESSIYISLHEIAQINAAKYLYEKTKGKYDIVLEKRIGTGKYQKVKSRWGTYYNREITYEADIVMDNRLVWEVKPLKGKDPIPQLQLYEQFGGLTKGEDYVGHVIPDITVLGDLKMRLTFSSEGVIHYETYFYNNGKTSEVTNVAAAAWLLKELIKIFGSGGKRMFPAPA